MDWNDLIDQLQNERRVERQRVEVRPFDPVAQDLFGTVRVIQGGDVQIVTRAALMKSGIVVKAFEEVGRCRHCKEYDAIKAMATCSDCRLVSCMDCMKEFDGKLLCKDCHKSAKAKHRLSIAGKALVWLAKLKIQF